MMGKRRKAVPVGRKWGSDSTIALIGLLDFSIKHTLVFPFTEENVVSHLCAAGSPHNGYTWNQINRKLGSLWDRKGSDYSLNKADIYVEGSACLVGLTEDAQSAVDLIVERLEKLLLKPTSLRKNALKGAIARKTPSASPFTIKGGQSETSETYMSNSDRLTPRAQRHQTRELRKQSEWKWESPEGSLSEDGVPRKRTRRTEKDSQTTYNQQGKQGSDSLGREQLLLEPSTENEKYNNLSAVPTSLDCNPHELAPLGLGSENRRLQGDPVPSSTTLEQIHRAALQKKVEKIIELQEALSANEEKFVDFQTQLDSFGSVQERRQEGEDSLNLLVSNLNQEIRHLKRAKDDCRKIGTFTKLAGRFNAAREEMHMETHVPIIRRLMKNILGGCEDDTTLKIPNPNISVGLRALLSFGFGFELDDQTLLGKEQFELLVSNRPPYSIIETLIGAAVCTWVFESSFPSFEQGSGDLSLLSKYRELIGTQDGAITLRNLELATHHSLINSSRFHRLMDEEAENLADSLSKTLAPFFTRNSRESEENDFETWGEEESVWKVRRQRLIAIFKDALKIKANSLLTPERYELVYYAPGTVFDPETMSVETIDGAPVHTPAKGGHRVEHCLHVAIQAYTRDIVKNTDPVSKATIQSKNFTRGDTTKPLGGTTPTVLSKAIVVLREQADEDAHLDGTGTARPVAVT